jgi:hypothetical protein
VVLLDLKILLQTVPVVIRRNGWCDVGWIGAGTGI